MNGPKRIWGRLTASQIAAVSATASFLPRFLDMQEGVTNLGAICLTVWPCWQNCHAQ